MTRLIDLTLWKPISFGGDGSINYFSEPKHRINLDGAIVRIEGDGDVALLPFSDNVARSTPAPSAAEVAMQAHLDDRPFLVAAAILTPTIDQKMASQKVKK
jgi:hypothetical protein